MSYATRIGCYLHKMTRHRRLPYHSIICKRAIQHLPITSNSIIRTSTIHQTYRNIGGSVYCNRMVSPTSHQLQYQSLSSVVSVRYSSTSTKDVNRLLGLDEDFSSDDIANKKPDTRIDSLLEYYDSLVQSGEVTRDVHQIQALKELDRLRDECILYLNNQNNTATATTIDNNNSEEESWSTLTSIFSLKSSWSEPDQMSSNHNQLLNPPPKGVYLHGGVGCGKTYCMDLFYHSLPSSPTMKKQKVHFHKFMLNVHKQMHNAKMIEKLQGDDVINYVIQSIVKNGKILCFDEFQVTDVADALILKRLFTGLIDNGVVIVATSNRPPSDLYKGGLQRDLFLPFIDLLEEKCTVVDMWKSETDYRTIHSCDTSRQQVYFIDNDEENGISSKPSARESYLKLFNNLTKDALTINSMTLDVGQGRQIFVPIASEELDIARFTFCQLCSTAKGAADYLAIGHRFHTVFVDDVPKLKFNEVNLVRRWITFIDSMYECHVRLIILAQTEPEEMFEVDLDSQYDEVFAFDRTRSRMEEMRSDVYLKKHHHELLSSA